MGALARLGPDPAGHRPAETVPPAALRRPAATVLGLQRAAGNAATTRALRSAAGGGAARRLARCAGRCRCGGGCAEPVEEELRLQRRPAVEAAGARSLARAVAARREAAASTGGGARPRS